MLDGVAGVVSIGLIVGAGAAIETFGSGDADLVGAGGSSNSTTISVFFVAFSASSFFSASLAFVSDTSPLMASLIFNSNKSLIRTQACKVIGNREVKRVPYSFIINCVSNRLEILAGGDLLDSGLWQLRRLNWLYLVQVERRMPSLDVLGVDVNVHRLQKLLKSQTNQQKIWLRYISNRKE